MFNIDDRVVIHSTGSDLDGVTGVIKGVLKRFLVDDFIIFLDKKVKGYDPAIVLIESCIKLV